MDCSDLVDSLHEQNLRLLAERFSLTMAIAVHRSRSAADRIQVVAPEFGSLAPTDAMVLFDQVRLVLERRAPSAEIEAGEGIRVGVVTSGPLSRAAYLLGDLDPPGAPDENGDEATRRRAQLVSAAAGLGGLVHSLEATARRPDPADVAVDVIAEAGVHRVSVRISAPGCEPVESVAVGPHPARAAAVAAARSIDPDARLVTLRCTEVGGVPVVLAVVSIGRGAPAMGMASARGGPNAAVARAAYRAAASAA